VKGEKEKKVKPENEGRKGRGHRDKEPKKMNGGTNRIKKKPPRQMRQLKRKNTGEKKRKRKRWAMRWTGKNGRRRGEGRLASVWPRKKKRKNKKTNLQEKDKWVKRRTRRERQPKHRRVSRFVNKGGESSREKRL